MPIPSRDTGGGGDFKKMPPGIHAAVCDQVVSIGIQKVIWAGEEKHQPKVYLRFEVPKQRLEYEKDGEKFNRPMSIGVTLTNSLNEKAALRKFLDSWRGTPFTEADLKGFDLMKVLGQPCIITVEHKEKADKTYANITAIRKFPKDGLLEVGGIQVTLEKPVAEMPLLAFDPDHEPGAYDKLPDWLKKLVEARVHPQAAAQAETTANPTPDFQDDDIPF